MIRDHWTLIDPMGNVAVSFASFIEASIDDAGKVSIVQVEKGSFAAYNKTDSPLDVYVTLAIEGRPDEQQAALQKLKTLKSGTTLLSLVTPAEEYQSLNLESYSYSRKRESGGYLLLVELHLVEIRQSETRVTKAVSIPKAKAKKPGDVSTVNTGKKKPGSILNDL